MATPLVRTPLAVPGGSDRTDVAVPDGSDRTDLTGNRNPTPSNRVVPPVSTRGRKPSALRRRVLLALAALGGAILVAYAIHDVFPAPAPGSALAGTVAQKVNALAGNLGRQERDLARCAGSTEADPLACLEGHDTDMAATLSAFAVSLGKLTLPPAATSARGTAVRTVDLLAQDLRALGTAADEQQYQTVAARRDVGPLGTRVDHALNTLVSAVRSERSPSAGAHRTH